MEFAFVFPMAMLLFLACVDLGVMAIQRLVLESMCLRGVRQLSLSTLKTSKEMESLFADAAVSLRSVPTVPQTNPLRQKKEVEIIELTLNKKVAAHFPFMKFLLHEFPMKFSTRARAVRICKTDPV